MTITPVGGGWMCVEHFMAILPTVAETFVALKEKVTRSPKSIIFAIWEPWKFIPIFFCQSIVPCDEKSDLLDSSFGGHENIISWQSMWHLLRYFSKSQTSIIVHKLCKTYIYEPLHYDEHWPYSLFWVGPTHTVLLLSSLTSTPNPQLKIFPTKSKMISTIEKLEFTPLAK